MTPKAERSRVTMDEVIRWCRVHHYPLVFVENVVDVAGWEKFPQWLDEMKKLDYHYKLVSFNAMFAPAYPPVPQSRDRLYICLWKKGNPEPRL